MQLFTLQSDEAYYYGFVFFRQTKDKSIRRGYFQKVWNMHTEIDEIMVLALVFIIISTEETGYLPVIILDFPWPQHWAFWPQKSSIFYPIIVKLSYFYKQRFCWHSFRKKTKSAAQRALSEFG